MEELKRFERENKVSLPKLYNDFYKYCDSSIPDNLIGVSLVNHNTNLFKWATELLDEDGVENFLDKDDFVFMMNQGYIFWYFKANGNSDPIVFGYHEGKLKPDNFGPLSEFLKRYL